MKIHRSALSGILLAVALSGQAGSWQSSIDAALRAQQQGDRELNLRHLKDALQQAEAFGEADPRFTQTLDLMGEYYLDQNEPAKAEEFIRQGLALRERFLGPQHYDVASSLDGLGRVFQARRQYEQAQEYYERALTIRERLLGSEDPWVAASLEHLADFALARDDFDQADSFYQRALAIRESSAEPSELAASLEAISGHFLRRGERSRSTAYAERALAPWSLGFPSVSTGGVLAVR